MNTTQPTAALTTAKERITRAKHILILTHENPTFDSIGSSLALYLGLRSLGKEVTIACPDPVRVEHSKFVAVDKIKRSIHKHNFVISLDYVEGSIEKVSYNIEGDKFNLVIEPRPGFPPFSKDKVSYTTGGRATDLIITIDTIHLGGLKALYEEEKDRFASTHIINIDTHPNNAQYGNTNIVDTSASSTSELVATVLDTLAVPLDADMGTNIVNGLFGATNNFQSPRVTARAFEIAAASIRAGGRRFQSALTQTPTPSVPKSARPKTLSKKPFVKPAPKQADASESPPHPAQAPGIQPPAPIGSKAPGPSTDGAQTPDDWLRPKIYKSRDTSATGK